MVRPLRKVASLRIAASQKAPKFHKSLFYADVLSIYTIVDRLLREPFSWKRPIGIKYSRKIYVLSLAYKQLPFSAFFAYIHTCSPFVCYKQQDTRYVYPKKKKKKKRKEMSEKKENSLENIYFIYIYNGVLKKQIN